MFQSPDGLDAHEYVRRLDRMIISTIIALAGLALVLIDQVT